jgi:hypothetical protein
LVLVRLEGGLGNQMFQYALGRHISIRRQEELVIDLTVLTRARSIRKYELDCFNITGRLINDVSVLKDLSILWIVRELSFGFDSQVLDTVCPNVMLHGLWQTPRYFEAISGVVKNDFSFTFTLSPIFEGLSREFIAGNSIGVHVRRTDYLDTTYGMYVLDSTYYDRALAYMADIVSDPVFLIFSDDIEWCRRSLCIPYRHILVPHSDHGREHLQLMARCRHFIVANSTFSWWAAWLGAAPDKIVVAPQRWFASEGAWNSRAMSFIRSDDIIPKEWKRL